MKKAVKTKWLKALRSGEYKQTEGELRNGDSFCCLGVLCNLHAKAHPEIARLENDPGEYLGCSGLLPIPVAEWAGFNLDYLSADEDVGTDIPVSYRNKITGLSVLNDVEGLSFKKIANVIERCL